MDAGRHDAPSIFNDKRFANRMHLFQFRRSQLGFRIAFVRSDSVGKAQFLKQPKDALPRLCLSKIKSEHIRGAIRRGLGGKKMRPALFTVRDRGASLSKAKCVRVSL